MIRIQDNIWLKKDSIEGIIIQDNKVKVFNSNDLQWEIHKKYLTDALTGLNINVGDVLAQIGRNERGSNKN